jgi:hypothetical protein
MTTPDFDVVAVQLMRRKLKAVQNEDDLDEQWKSGAQTAIFTFLCAGVVGVEKLWEYENENLKREETLRPRGEE